jgi:hypothetical protein
MRASLFFLCIFLAACPPDDKKGPPPAKTEGCTRIGQTCEFAPGKLGTCVQRDDCTTPPCFTCQSQH